MHPLSMKFLCHFKIYKTIPVSFDFITTLNQGVFLCSPCKSKLPISLWERYQIKISKYIQHILPWMMNNQTWTLRVLQLISEYCAKTFFHKHVLDYVRSVYTIVTKRVRVHSLSARSYVDWRQLTWFNHEYFSVHCTAD